MSVARLSHLLSHPLLTIYLQQGNVWNSIRFFMLFNPSLTLPSTKSDDFSEKFQTALGQLEFEFQAWALGISACLVKKEKNTHILMTGSDGMFGGWERMQAAAATRISRGQLPGSQRRQMAGTLGLWFILGLNSKQARVDQHSDESGTFEKVRDKKKKKKGKAWALRVFACLSSTSNWVRWIEEMANTRAHINLKQRLTHPEVPLYCHMMPLAKIGIILHCLSLR